MKTGQPIGARVPWTPGTKVWGLDRSGPFVVVRDAGETVRVALPDGRESNRSAWSLIDQRPWFGKDAVEVLGVLGVGAAVLGLAGGVILSVLAGGHALRSLGLIP